MKPAADTLETASPLPPSFGVVHVAKCIESDGDETCFVVLLDGLGDIRHSDCLGPATLLWSKNERRWQLWYIKGMCAV